MAKQITIIKIYASKNLLFNVLFIATTLGSCRSGVHHMRDEQKAIYIRQEQQAIDSHPRSTTSHTPKTLNDAIRTGDITLIRQLLDNGADVDARNENGHTPLHVALIAGQPTEIIALLLKHGAKVDEKDLEYAFIDNNTDLIKLFAQHIVSASNATHTIRSTPLRRLVIIGDDVPEHFQSNISSMGEDCVIVSYTTKRDAKITDLLKTISGRGMYVDANTRIEIYAHGIVEKYNKHHIALFQCIPTGAFFVYLRAIMQVPIQIHLFSCYVGAAMKDIGLLEEDSTLITYCDPKLPTTFPQEAYVITLPLPTDNTISPYQSIIYRWISCAINSVTIRGITEMKETTCAFMHPTEFVSKVVNEAPGGTLLHDIVCSFFIEECNKLGEAFPAHKDKIIAVRDKVRLGHKLTEELTEKYISGVLSYIIMYKSLVDSTNFGLFVKELYNQGFNLSDTINKTINNPFDQSMLCYDFPYLEVLLQYDADKTVCPPFQATYTKGIADMLVKRYMNKVYNEAQMLDKKFHINFDHILCLRVKQIDHTIIIPTCIESYIMLAIDDLSDDDRCAILFNSSLPKALYNAIKNNASCEEITDCISECLRLDPKKKIIEGIFQCFIELIKLKHDDCVPYPILEKIQKKIRLFLYSLDYDTLKSKKQAIRDQIFKVFLSNQSIEDIYNQVIAYINTLHQPTITTTDQERNYVCVLL